MLLHMADAKPSRKGFILAGGRSSRMGSDKAFLEFGGQTLLDRALGVVGTACGNVTIVGDPVKFAKYETTKFGRTVADIFPGCGPLGGIHAALAQSSAELSLMLAVDMPFVSSELLEFLFTAAGNAQDAVVTVPRTSHGLQPLCAVYRRDFFAVAEQQLRAGKYKIDAAFANLSMRLIEADELQAAGFPEQCFFNLNTPEDRMAAEGPSF
jgi:molybdopterin-guanine dinucleotide biosynthesis protein A